MSWSINLYGPREVVKRELADAILLLDKAIDWVENAELENTTVNLNGHLNWSLNSAWVPEIYCSTVNFSVSESSSPPSELEEANVSSH